MNRRIVVGAAIVLALGGGVAVAGCAVAAGGRTEDPSQRSAGSPPATATVERGAMSNSVQVDGTIGYAQERTLNAGATGTVTWVAEPGAVIERDTALYKVDERPIRAWYGTVPMYRTVGIGAEGEDVEAIEQNLRALGYGSGLTVDRRFTAATARAVGRWQHHHGLARTGTLGADQIVIVPAAVRVTKAAVPVGDRVAESGPMITVSGVDHVVRFQLDAGRGNLAEIGGTVTVDLPAGGTIPATISWVSPVAEKGEDQSAPKITVMATMGAGAAGALVQESPAAVHLTGETRPDVLSVPVNALLALPGGGFGVQLVENGATREVAVELGMFGRGRVEVSGAGLAEGDVVGVPAA